MKIKVYANYDREVISEKEYQDKVQEEVKDFDEDDFSFSEFLEDNYDHLELFDMSEEEKEKVKELFHKKNLKRAEDNLYDEWTENIIDV